MSEASVAMAKLAGIRKAVLAVASENVSRNRGKGEVLTRANFAPELVAHYFAQAQEHLEVLRRALPTLFADFQGLPSEPEARMLPTGPGEQEARHFSRAQVERLVRDIDQIFELRANSELAQPNEPRAKALRRVFMALLKFEWVEFARSWSDRQENMPGNERRSAAQIAEVWSVRNGETPAFMRVAASRRGIGLRAPFRAPSHDGCS